ncbi:HEAT repeat domain-containing protein [Moorena sp. SIO3H5]|uniref:HEAT repeat domain-containing protein n=1 Tax=Moorena sp. SIO3H5 TaxID=2607834 RepID=UPI0013BAA2B5|nr:HEAT repeat domain-containing protein [Moorena sp. SIO3H5]NEO73153.1 HEAT repeat domain-containing protein [Moorena sp. SIO3H5]
MSTEELYKQLKNKNPKLRQRAMRQIAAERTENTIPELMAILDNEDVVYRRAAVQTLGVIGLDSVPILAETLTTSENNTVRASCAKALAAIALNYSEETFPTVGLQSLQKALKDPDPVVKISTVGALGTIGPPAFEALVAALDIDDIALQVTVLQALGSLGDQRAMEVLSAAAENQEADPYIRESAASSISRLEQIINFGSARKASRE